MWGRLQPARDFSPAEEARIKRSAGGLKPALIEGSIYGINSMSLVSG